MPRRSENSNWKQRAKHWPIGSLAVDASLVIVVTWWGSEVTSTLKTLDGRVNKAEAELTSRAAALTRLSVVEGQIEAHRILLTEYKNDIIRVLEQHERRLEKLEDKK